MSKIKKTDDQYFVLKGNKYRFVTNPEIRKSANLYVDKKGVIYYIHPVFFEDTFYAFVVDEKMLRKDPDINFDMFNVDADIKVGKIRNDVLNYLPAESVNDLFDILDGVNAIKQFKNSTSVTINVEGIIATLDNTGVVIKDVDDIFSYDQLNDLIEDIENTGNNSNIPFDIESVNILGLKTNVSTLIKFVEKVNTYYE